MTIDLTEITVAAACYFEPPEYTYSRPLFTGAPHRISVVVVLIVVRKYLRGPVNRKRPDSQPHQVIVIIGRGRQQSISYNLIMCGFPQKFVCFCVVVAIKTTHQIISSTWWWDL